MKRRDLLKVLAALPLVGRLVRKEEEPFLRPDEWVWADAPQVYDSNDTANPFALPPLCPLCEAPWAMYRLTFNPLAWDCEPTREPCHHPYLPHGLSSDGERSAYVAQLRRRREMEEYMKEAFKSLECAKIRAIDRVLTYLGEKP